MQHFIRIPFVLAHVFLICLSNVLVQYPFSVLGLSATWGAFSYPLIFVLTDLSTRFSGALAARKIVYTAMFPGLLCSYFISSLYTYGSIWVFNALALRIALASLCAYVFGQVCDIAIFQRLRTSSRWWLAPAVGNASGCIVDTYVFFFIAFYQGSNAFLSQHWPEIAALDLSVKLIVSLFSVLPTYRLALGYFEKRHLR